ncbi:MAG: hypothetical protein IPL83_08230 [Bdellovibrionales bacterium]|nr:hypothetical protein [Bdellovibrionales bacterium]
MKLTVSWWDSKEGIGVALTEGGQNVYCIDPISHLYRPKFWKPRLIIHGEIRTLSKDVVVVEKVRTSKSLESPQAFRKLLRDAVAA